MQNEFLQLLCNKSCTKLNCPETSLNMCGSFRREYRDGYNVEKWDASGDEKLTLSKAYGLWHFSRSGSMRWPGSAREQRGRAAGHTLLAELHGALPPPHHACSHPHIRTETEIFAITFRYLLLSLIKMHMWLA